MEADITVATEVNRLEHVSQSDLATRLPLLFQKILDPNLEARLVYSYVVSLRRVFSRERQGVENPESPGHGFSRFGKAALDAGLVPTMKSVISTTNQGNYVVLAIYYGIDTLTRLCKTGTLAQNRTLAKQIMEHDLLPIIYDRLDTYPYFIVRIYAAEFISTMARESDYFATQPDMAVTAEMIFQCCKACLAGPDLAWEEMHDPSRRWTTRHLWEGQRIMTTQEAVNYAPRRYCILQEKLFLSVRDLVAPLPIRKKTTVLEMIRSRPQFLDQITAIGSEPRPPWYPETEVYSVASECLASLLNFPMDRVPGVPVSGEGDLQREIDEEWSATLEILRMLTAIPWWITKLYGMWKRVESERWLAIQVYLDQVTDNHHVKHPHALHHILKQKGVSRISILRTVISLTYVPDTLPDFFLLTFLRVAYACSQKIPQVGDVPVHEEVLNEEDLIALHLSVERSQEVARKPHWIVMGNLDEPDYSSVLYREEFAGPIAFLRLLLLVSQRDILSKIPSWSTIPSYSGNDVQPGMKEPSISQLKQITSPAVIRKFLSMSLKKVKELREVRGRREVQTRKLGDATWSYACGSELSAAIVAFLENPRAETELKTKFLDDAKKELVLGLGNAAEMSIREQRHLKGLKFASAAVAIGAECTGITEAIATKNKNRYTTALSGVH